jgi:hypothetical protein
MFGNIILKGDVYQNIIKQVNSIKEAHLKKDPLSAQPQEMKINLQNVTFSW